MPTITLPDKISIKLPHGAGAIDVSLTAFDADTWLAIVNNGLKQKIGDSMADKEKTLAIDGIVPTGFALHEAVRDFATKRIDRIVSEGWRVREGGGGAKLSDPRDVWLRDEAERAARAAIASGRAMIDGRRVTKALPADVRAIRDRLLASPGWCTHAMANYVPPADIEDDLLSDPAPAAAAA